MEYDAFQKKAIHCIERGESVIVAAPTGAGKTVIAEHVITDCMRNGRKVIYTAPIKALSNQKFRDFQDEFPDQVGIMTGDITLNADAPTLIMTTEIFRNKLLEQNDSLQDFSWVIFDEIHYLDDYERGTVWEESLIFLPEHMKILGLSATIPNVRELADWLKAIHKRPVTIIREDKRPVPLHVLYQCQGKIYDNFHRLIRYGYKSPEYVYYGGRRIPKHIPVKPNRLGSLVKHIDDEGMLPCIYFVFSRRKTEELAQEMLTFDFLDGEEKREVRELYERLCDRYDLNGELSAEELRPFISQGIAYHHAGMLPTLKEVVERLFTSRLIKLIFTTETFALGINMPAKTVVFDELTKFYGRSFAPLKTRDFYQMAGRAGRRSIDEEGFVFVRVNPHYISPRELHRIIFHEPEKVQSRFNASYATILNLYAQYEERLYDVYPLSFHYFQERKSHRGRALESLRARVMLLKEFGHIVNNRLTEKGIFASKVYGYELILAELFEEGILEKLSVMELGIMCLAIVYEPRKGQHRPRLAKRYEELDYLCRDVVRGIQRREKRLGIKPVSKLCYFHLSLAMEVWIRGKRFDEALAETDVDEGEVVRNFRMCLQIMRQMLDTPISDAMKRGIRELLRKIDRDVIDSEKQLRS